MDTFLVRTLLVPSAVVLIGRWNWWPSALYRARPPATPATQTTPATPAAPPDGGPGTSFTAVELLLKLRNKGREGHEGSRDRDLAEPTRGHL
jgi:hypothetical protein